MSVVTKEHRQMRPLRFGFTADRPGTALSVAALAAWLRTLRGLLRLRLPPPRLGGLPGNLPAPGGAKLPGPSRAATLAQQTEQLGEF